MKSKLLVNYKPAKFFIKSGIKKPTFFQRVALREIEFVQISEGQKLYSLRDWNEKCSEKFPIDENYT